MAALDKLYLNYTEYQELKEILENQPITDFMKSKGHNYPLVKELWVDYWSNWEQSPEEVHPVMYPSPVMWIWLVENCKIKSVLEQVEYKTDKEAILNGTHPWLTYKRKPCKKVVAYNKYNTPIHIHNKNKTWHISCKNWLCMFYTSDKKWRLDDEGWSGGDGWTSTHCMKFKSVKAIIKHLLKSAPADLTFEVTSRWRGDDFIIKTY